MSNQPEALRLAEALETPGKLFACYEVATELRRLHEAHDWQHKMAGDRLRRIEKLEAINRELLEALLLMVATHDEPAGFVGKYGRALDEAINKQQLKIDARLLKARAAIAKAEGQT
jgi:hypothetical protein